MPRTLFLHYIDEIRRQFRDVYGFKPVRGTAAEPVFGEGQIPDGVYPMTIKGRVDRVHVVNGIINCCNFDKLRSTKTKKGPVF